MSSSVCWKKVWLTVSGDIRAVTITEARNVLNIVQNDLLVGLGQYKPYKENSLELISVLRGKLKENGSVLELFIEKLNYHLNLQSDVCWEILCNFLMFEYYGRVDEVQKIAEHELYNVALIEQVWQFYTCERMYLMKMLKHIMEYGTNHKHRFFKMYSEFMDETDIGALRTMLIKQYYDLTEEIIPNREDRCVNFRDWVFRNLKEQLETLHLLMLTTDYMPCTAQEFIAILEVCRKHNFGMKPKNELVLLHYTAIDIRISKLTQLSVLILAAKIFWENSADWQANNAEIEDKILNTMYQDELSILLLLFISLQLATADKQVLDKYAPIYSKYMKLVLDQKVYYHLSNLILLPKWTDTHLGFIVKHSVLCFVEYSSYNFEENTSILNFIGVDDLLAGLAREPVFALHMLKEEDTYYKIFTQVLDMFPQTFIIFSKVFAQLLSHKDMFSRVFNLMCHISHYTEIYKESPYDSDLVLRQDYTPKLVKSIRIPAGTKARIKEILEGLFVTFEYNYTYFDVLEDSANILHSGVNITKENLEVAHLGYQCILSILKHNSYTHYHMVRNLLKPLQTIILTACQGPIHNLELVATCLDIYELSLHKEADMITEGLLVNNFLPHAVKDSAIIDNIFERNFLNTSLILLAIQEEIGYGRLHVTFSYIKFLKTLIHHRKCMMKVVLPGIVFLTLHIFPLHLSWTYELPSDKQRLSVNIIDLILSILQIDSMNWKDDEKVIHDFCIRLTATHMPVIEILNELFRIEDTYLIVCAINEGNSEKNSSYLQLQCLKKMLTIISILLSYNNRGIYSLKDSNFFKVFLNSSIKPSSLKLLTSYMQQIFSWGIPKLSCQVLKKLAVNSDIPMLSLLEMDEYQLQCTFLEKLRDPLEEESLKVAILDLITLCVQKQDGMIMAFFNVTEIPGVTENIGDTVIAFMAEYLANIKKSTDYLNSPIQTAVLHLFHSLWMYRKNSLVANLTQNESFWTTLMGPLFKEINLPDETYSQIFDILTHETFRSRGVNLKINQVIKRLFAKKEPFTSLWSERVLKSLREDTKLHLFHSWRNLVIATCRNYPDAVSDVTQRHYFIQICLNGITDHFARPGDTRVLLLWGELLLYLITKWPNVVRKDTSKILNVLIRIFKYFEDFYLDISHQLKEIILSISLKIIRDAHNNRENDGLVLEEYLRAIGKILEKEFAIIMNNTCKNNPSSVYSNWILLITFGTCLLETHSNLYHDWFKRTEFLAKALKSIRIFVQNFMYFPIAKITVQCLIAYARSPFINHFVCEDLQSFYDATRPSELYINASNLNYKNAIPWHFEDWWLTYTGIVQLMVILLQKFGTLFLEELFAFALAHTDIMRNVMRLPTVTAERSALQLVLECLNFIRLLLKWKTQWRFRHEEVYFSYLDSINETINAVICIVLRPTVLKFFTMGEDMETTLVDQIPTNCLVEIVNTLMDTLTASCLCLFRAFPSMMSFFNQEKFPFVDDVPVEHVFHIPKIKDETASKLKYGSLLCLLHFLCKTSMVQRGQSRFSTDLDTSDSSSGSAYLAFVCPDFFGSSLADKYNSLQTFASLEFPRLSTKWLKRLDPIKVNTALETLSGFLGRQIALTVYTRPMKSAQLYHIKRELCSELLYFHEFTRKKSMERHLYRTFQNIVFRKYYNGTLPYLIGDDESTAFAKVAVRHEQIGFDVSPTSSVADDTDDLVEDEKEPIFYDRNDFTSLVSVETSMDEEEPKPLKVRPSFSGRKGFDKTVVEKVTLSYSANLPHNEDDYLLMLSHWFFHICDLSN